MPVLSHLMTSWGRLRAGDYAKVRRMHIRLPKAARQQSLPVEQTLPVVECGLSASLEPPRRTWNRPYPRKRAGIPLESGAGPVAYGSDGGEAQTRAARCLCP